VNNVETIVKVPWIILHGGDKYRKYGTEDTPGTKLFCISGKACRKLVVELPLGVTLREIVYAYAEGVYGDGELKLIQTGGKAGTFVPKTMLDAKMDFTGIKRGISLGSGAIILIDDSRDLVDIFSNVVDFFEHESCGKCTPCREGLFLLKRISEEMLEKGEVQSYIPLIEKTVKTMGETALCGLGQSVQNPILSLISTLKGGEVA
jgi:NADH:ubiquinone oxidoreductase subunit F (NADH-binding)